MGVLSNREIEILTNNPVGLPWYLGIVKDGKLARYIHKLPDAVEIVDLKYRFGVLTEYTSYLIKDIMVDDPIIEKDVIDLVEGKAAVKEEVTTVSGTTLNHLDITETEYESLTNNGMRILDTHTSTRWREGILFVDSSTEPTHCVYIRNQRPGFFIDLDRQNRTYKFSSVSDGTVWNEHEGNFPLHSDIFDLVTALLLDVITGINLI